MGLGGRIPKGSPMKTLIKNVFLCMATVAIFTPSFFVLKPLQAREAIVPVILGVTLDENGQPTATKILNPEDAINALKEELSQIADHQQATSNHADQNENPQPTDGQLAIQAAKLVLKGCGGLLVLGWLGGKLVLVETFQVTKWMLTQLGLLDTSKPETLDTNSQAIVRYQEPPSPIVNGEGIGMGMVEGT